jgi:hypothetical protein
MCIVLSFVHKKHNLIALPCKKCSESSLLVGDHAGAVTLNLTASVWFASTSVPVCLYRIPRDW